MEIFMVEWSSLVPFNSWKYERVDTHNSDRTEAFRSFDAGFDVTRKMSPKAENRRKEFSEFPYLDRAKIQAGGYKNTVLFLFVLIVLTFKIPPHEVVRVILTSN